MCVRSKCLLLYRYILLSFPKFNMQWNHIQIFSPFNPTNRLSVCVCKGRTCACMILYAPFSFIDMQHDYFKKKKSLTFDYTPGVAGVCKD